MEQLENAHALVIGIDTGYQHVRRLPATRDAATIAELLTNPQEGGYPAGNVRSLINEQATRQAILDGLEHLATATDTDSTVFLYFSGHGGRIADGPAAGAYLLPADADPTSDATLAATSISGDQLTAVLDRLPARKAVIIFDACHAGGIGALRDLTAAEVGNGLPESYFDRLAAGHGRVIFSSSEETETSLVFENDGYGLFTKHLLGGLRGGIPSEDGMIRVFDLFEYLQPRVTSEAAPHPQHPIFKAHLRENFPVAMRLGGERAAVPRDADGYRFDVYINYADEEPDATWVWDTLVPRLEDAGLRVAVSGDSLDPGVPKLVNAERGITQAKRTVAVLSDAYLADNAAGFENLIAQMHGLRTGTWPLIPVSFGEYDKNRLPLRIDMLESLELGDSGGGANRRTDRAMQRLIDALRGPVPR